MRLTYHPDAEAELIEAAEFYESRVSTLGAQFLDAAERAIGTIQNAPDRWRIIDSDIRSYLMPRVPLRDLLPGHARRYPHPRIQAPQPRPELLTLPDQGLTWIASIRAGSASL
jgi:hypothetical protein